MTKKNASLLASYEYAVKRGTDSLYKAYSRPSENKMRAFRDCEADRITHKGYGAVIAGASSHFFSYAFKYMSGDKEHLRYHTYANVYDFEIE